MSLGQGRRRTRPGVGEFRSSFRSTLEGRKAGLLEAFSHVTRIQRGWHRVAPEPSVVGTLGKAGWSPPPRKPRLLAVRQGSRVNRKTRVFASLLSAARRSFRFLYLSLPGVDGEQLEGLNSHRPERVSGVGGYNLLGESDGCENLASWVNSLTAGPVSMYFFGGGGTI